MRDYKYYVFRLDKSGTILNGSYGSRTAVSQQDALERARKSTAIKAVKEWDMTLVVYSPVMYDEIDYRKHRDLWDYWVYDKDDNLTSGGPRL